jgi:hypothetical protein
MLSKYEVLEAESARRARCPFKTYFPDTGPYRRELYPRSLIFFAAGKVRTAGGDGTSIASGCSWPPTASGRR